MLSWTASTRCPVWFLVSLLNHAWFTEDHLNCFSHSDGVSSFRWTLFSCSDVSSSYSTAPHPDTSPCMLPAVSRLVFSVHFLSLSGILKNCWFKHFTYCIQFVLPKATGTWKLNCFDAVLVLISMEDNFLFEFHSELENVILNAYFLTLPHLNINELSTK